MAPVTDPDLKDSRQQRAGRPAGELAQMALSCCMALSLLLNDLLLTAGSLFAYMREQTCCIPGRPSQTKSRHIDAGSSEQTITAGELPEMAPMRAQQIITISDHQEQNSRQRAVSITQTKSRHIDAEELHGSL